MKITAILFTVLLGFSVNALAVEPVLKEVPALQNTEFSSEKKQMVKADLANFMDFFTTKSKNLQRQFEVIKQSSANDEKTQANNLLVEYLLRNLIRFRSEIELWQVKTPEVRLIQQDLIEFLDLQITYRKREAEIGFGKINNDPELLNILKKMNQLDKRATKHFYELNQKLK